MMNTETETFTAQENGTYEISTGTSGAGLRPKKKSDPENQIVPAYSYTMKNGKTMVVSCPKRLLGQVQEDELLDLKKDFKKL